MLKNVTITLSEEAAQWARRKAAEENTSVSKLVGRMLENQMRMTDDYWKAYERWKKIKPIKGFDASKRLKRDELYDRP
ncbi:MAG: CopG family transcriptional regulator [Bryobacteraceae bacterium]